MRTQHSIVASWNADNRGSSLIETAITLPLVLLIAFGIIEVGYVLLDSHTVTRLSREGSNLISRNTTIDEAVTGVSSMSTGLVDFSTNAKVVFSVIKRGLKSARCCVQKWDSTSLLPFSICIFPGVC